MYENYPSAAGGNQMPEPARPPAPPTSVQTAVRLMYAGAVISAISFILGLATIGNFKHTLEKRYPNYTSQHINNLVSVEIAVVVIAGVIGVGLWLWMARMNAKGRNWARITGTVFFGLNTLDLLGVFSRSASAISAVFAIVIWLVGLAAVIMLWRRDSTAYFKRQQIVY